MRERIWLAGWILSAAVAWTARSADVPVRDPSFETNSLSAGGWTTDLSPDWSETNGPNNGSGFEEYIAGFAADGTDHLGMELGHDVWQDLSVTYQANTVYTLTVAVGNRSEFTASGNQSTYIVADSVGTIYATGITDASAVSVGSFADAPALTFNTAENPAAVGQTIRILLQARGANRSHFDHVRLTSEPFNVEGMATFGPLTTTNITSTGATLKGSIADIGDSTPTVTVFWGPSNGGVNPGNWANFVSLGSQAGAFQTTVSGLSAGSTYFFTARAVNTAGASWAYPVASFETAAQPPQVVTLAATDVRATTATVGAQVTGTGGSVPTVTIYYGTTDGGTNPAAWATSVSLGPQSGVATAPISGLAPVTPYHCRAFAQNEAGGAWAPASESFTTLAVSPPAVANRDPEGITGTTASLRGEVTETGNDLPVVTIFYGMTDGGTNPASWATSVLVGPVSGNFSRFVTGLTPATSYYYRCRAVNGAGTAWATSSVSFATTAPLAARAVINEFHYKPEDKTSIEEFIELHNPGDSALDLSGWTLRNAVSYTFPPGTVLPAAGYLVVATNPATILAKYGVTALGPWGGNLAAEGENIDLHDAVGVRQDRVGYSAGFPWPTGADGGGASAELIHPGLDNDLGGSWRSSGYGVSATPQTNTYIAASSAGWRYKKGTAEASSPVDAWRATAYDDSAWSTGTAAFGYRYTVNTTLSDMRYNYSTVYFRKTFIVSADAMPDHLILRMRYDDGIVVWLNGVEIARRMVNGGQLGYDATATSSHDGNAWEEIVLPVAEGQVYGGSNVIAVHGLNSDRDNRDFVIDLQLYGIKGGGGTAPTPGARNSVYRQENAVPPQIRQVGHSPKEPGTNVPVTITAKITDPNGMGAVSLSYQTVDPGAYIRLTDAAYTTTWTTVAMYDDGTHGDALAGDAIYSAVLPSTLQTNRRLVRYRITFQDALANAETVPYPDDEQPNFAYYVYAGLPAWSGSFNPGASPIQTYPSNLLARIPVYTLVASGTDVINSQYNSGYDAVQMRGTLVYDGEVYDHILYRNRGEASTYVSGKNKWRFYFNRSRDLEARNNFGKRYAETWVQFSGEACSSPWAAVHRGMAGVEEAVSYKIFQLAGVPSPHTHYYHFRVVRGATETPPAGTTVVDPIGTADGQYAGDFWGLYLALEPVKGSFLDERGLPEGNLYKIEGNAGDKKAQGPTQVVDSSDWNTFRDAHVNADQNLDWWGLNMDLQTYYTFHALNRLIGDVDVRGGYNHYFYHRPTDGRWVVIPWDLDMMFVARSHWTTSINGTDYPGVIHAHKALLQHPALAQEYRNRAREILDLLASDGSPTGGQIGQLIREFADIVHPAGETNTWANADAAMWNMHPRTQGDVSSHSGQTSHKGNFFYTPFTDNRFGGDWVRWLRSPSFTGAAAHEDCMTYLRDYAIDTWPSGSAWAVNNGNQLGYGYQYVFSESADADIPNRPVATAAGTNGFAVNDLSFTSSAFGDPQGAGTYAATEWRMGEISAPGMPGYEAGTAPRYEIEAVWTSGELTGAPGTIVIPDGVAEEGKTYRVRVRHKDNTGRWSRWSEPVTFQAGARSASPLLYYWNFNDDDTLATLLAPTRSYTGGGAITPALTLPAEVTSDTGQDFTGINARDGDPAAEHLRVNFPTGAVLTVSLPTPGYKDIIVKYETRRSTQGAGTQRLSYTLNGTDFTWLTDVAVPNAAPQLTTLDFTGIAGVADNPAFGLRIQFLQGGGGLAGNNRFDNLTVEGVPDTAGGIPRLLPREDASWQPPGNWSTAHTPHGTGVEAWICPPVPEGRTVDLDAPVTVGTLVFDGGDSVGRNGLSSGATNATLTFAGNGPSALLRVLGAGGGHAELDLGAGAVLASDLRLDVENVVGDPEYGALRLRETWSGPGGLIKQGAGIASLTGTGKMFGGAVVIEEGVLGMSQPAAPTQTVGVAVQPGGQLRLTSGDIGTGPRVYTLGGTVSLAGTGRGAGVPEGEQQGVLGALRYHPGSSSNHHAVLTNPIALTDDAEIHVDGTSNRMDLTGALSGAHLLTKSGGGLIVLSAASNPAFAGSVYVSKGALAVNGALPVAVALGSEASLEGSGRVGAVSGGGSISLDETVLTATSSTAWGLYRFVFTRTGVPAAGTPASSGNSLLRLTSANPFPSGPAGVDLFLDVDSRSVGDRFAGGFFTGAGYNLAAALAGAQVRLFVQDAAGTVTNRGQTYRAATPADALIWAVTDRTLDFGEGPVAGRILEIKVGGTPASYAQWRNLMFDNAAARENDAIAGPTASAAGDGISNLYRYAMGLGPYDPVDGRLPRIVRALEEMRYQYQLDIARTDVAWRVQATRDLQAWPFNLYRHDDPADPVPPLEGIWRYHVLPASLDGGPEPDRFQFLRLELWLLE